VRVAFLNFSTNLWCVLNQFESVFETHSKVFISPAQLGSKALLMIDCACDSLLQLPFLLGVPVLEKIAAPIAPFVVGQTGKQLFLTDGKPSDPPLLLRMASDCQEGPFMYVCSLFLGPLLSRCVCVLLFIQDSLSLSLLSVGCENFVALDINHLVLQSAQH
jgi:hypothetical protein